MKGQAYIATGTAIGKGSVMGSIGGRADALGMLHGSSRDVIPPATGEGNRTRESGLLSWIRVLPEQPQELVWLTPQVGIDYQIETSTDLEWQIK